MSADGDVNKFRFISDITGSFAMNEPFDPGYLEWQKRMKEEGFQVVSIVTRQERWFLLGLSRLYACGF